MFNLKENLRRIMTVRGFTPERLALESNVPLKTVRNLYYGKSKNPKLDTLVPLCETLQVTLDFLIYGHEVSTDLKRMMYDYMHTNDLGKTVMKSICKYAVANDDRFWDGKTAIMPLAIPNSKDYMCPVLEWTVPEQLITYFKNQE